MIPSSVFIFLQSRQSKAGTAFRYSLQYRKFLPGNFNPFPSFCIVVIIRFTCFLICPSINNNLIIISCYRTKLLRIFFITEKLWLHIFGNINLFSHLRIKCISICIRGIFRHDHIFTDFKINFTGKCFKSI